jgi:hypothetical protein
MNGTEYMDINSFVPRNFSYLNSSVVGAISAFSLPLLFHLYKNNRCCKFYLIYLTLAVGCITSLARASWLIFAVISLICIIYYKRWGIVYVLLLSATLVIYFINIEDLNFYQVLLVKIQGGTADAIGERADQIENGIYLIKQNPFGLGLGSVGHKSIDDGFMKVTDSNFLRIFAELGWLSGVFFLSIVSLPLILMLKQKDNISFTLALIIASFLFISIGTNIIDYNYSSNIFWMAIGIIASRHKSVNLNLKFNT